AGSRVTHLDADGTITGIQPTTFPDSANSLAIASDGDGYLMLAAYPEISAQRVDSNGSLIGGSKVLSVDGSAVSGRQPQLRWDGTGYVATYAPAKPQNPFGTATVTRLTADAQVVEARPLAGDAAADIAVRNGR